MTKTSPKSRISLQHINPGVGRGLEIGALRRPMVRREDADVYYVDVLDTEGLRAHYKGDPNVPPDDVVDVDFVLIQDGTTRSLAEAAAPAAPYDWAAASHVIEHVPDLIGFLADVARLLRPGGRIALVVPDRRFCFDALRPRSTVGDALLAHQHADTRPSVKAVFDRRRAARDGDRARHRAALARRDQAVGPPR